LPTPKSIAINTKLALDNQFGTNSATTSINTPANIVADSAGDGNVRRALVEKGVSLPVADELARTCSIQEVETACKIVQNTPNLRSPAGLLVQLLRSGGMTRLVEFHAKQALAKKARRDHQRRLRLINEMPFRIRKLPEGPRNEALALWGIISDRWPDSEQLAANVAIPSESFERIAEGCIDTLRRLAENAGAGHESSVDDDAMRRAEGATG
jgi:hypothetical protein